MLRRIVRNNLSVVIGLAIAAVLGSYLSYVMMFQYELGENVRRVDWLPPTATRVCWYRSYLNTAVEFDMPEEDFLAWVKKPETVEKYGIGEVTPIDPKDHPPFGVARYLIYLRYHTPRASTNLPPAVPPELMDISRKDATLAEVQEERRHLPEDQRWLAGLRTFAEPKRGWKSEVRLRPDSAHRIAYDADQGRVYYHFSLR